MSWTRVQSAGAIAGPVSLTSVAVGDLLIAGICNNGAEAGAISDGGNTWIKLNSKGGPGLLFYTDIWYTIVTAGGSRTVSAATQSFSGLAVVEFNPGGGTISTDGSVTSASGTSASPAAGNITIVTPDLVVGAFGVGNTGSLVWSSSGGYTVDSGSSAVWVGGSHFGVAIGYNLDAISSPADPVLGLSASSEWAAVGAAFNAPVTAASSGGAAMLAGFGRSIDGHDTTSRRRRRLLARPCR